MLHVANISENFPSDKYQVGLNEIMKKDGDWKVVEECRNFGMVFNKNESLQEILDRMIRVGNGCSSWTERRMD